MHYVVITHHYQLVNIFHQVMYVQSQLTTNAYIKQFLTYTLHKCYNRPIMGCGASTQPERTIIVNKVSNWPAKMSQYLICCSVRNVEI